MPSVTRQSVAMMARQRNQFQHPHYLRHGYSLNGLSSNGDSQCDALCTIGKAIPIVGSLVATIFRFLTGQDGQLKIEATQFAEGAVRVFYGLEPGCAMPPPNLGITPGKTPPYTFCASSVAGMIERCQLQNAAQLLQLIQQKFQQAMSQQPVGPYIARWWTEYGQHDVLSLTSIIQSAQSKCGVTVPPGSYQPPIGVPPIGTTNISPYLILGGIALIGFMFAMK